jgi:NADPH:quinone reductase-like Zn-dependent oxidoreductase
MAEEGRLRPILDPHVYDLASVMDAHALVESGSAKGKVVVTVAG